MFRIALLLFQLCAQPQTTHIGTLPPAVDEASGVALSRKFPDRLYHLNDSGSKGVIYSTDMIGGNLQVLGIEDFNPIDMEDLRIAECGNGRTCLFLADIGDNDRRRKTIEIILVEEPAKVPAKLRVLQRVRLQYPDGAHDSESFAVDPSGTLLLLTKDGKGLERLYKLPRKDWQKQNSVHTLQPAGEIRFKEIFPNAPALGMSPTSMDVSADGTRLLVLTYRDAVEFSLDLKNRTAISSPRRITLQFLMQQEAAAYLPDGEGFIYTSELMILPAWIMKASCSAPRQTR